MKKYTVNVHYDACVTVSDIIAENEEEALRKAMAVADTASLNESEAYYADSCVTSVEDIPEDAQKENS